MSQEPTTLLGLDSLADGARWLLILAFLLAGVEKAITLHSRSAAWHPVMLVSKWRRRNAVRLMQLSLASDVLVVALLVGSPSLGALTSSALLIAYSVSAATVHSSGRSGGCRCVWGLLNATTKVGLALRTGSYFPEPSSSNS